MDRHQRKELSVFAEYASEGDGRPYAPAGRGRHGRRHRGRLPVSHAPSLSQKRQEFEMGGGSSFYASFIASEYFTAS